jgi:hypothetical protein
MAVRALARPGARAPLRAATLPAAVLATTLLAPALDLIETIQPGLVPGSLALAASAVASGALIAMWIRFPRTSWLFAACLAAAAGLALRALGAEVAPLLSLLAILALGLGGAFSSVEVSLEAV